MNWFAILNDTGRSATELTRHAPAKERAAMRKAIIAQPGYRRGYWMTVARTVQGGYRLYVDINGKYMDGSLKDLPGIFETSNAAEILTGKAGN